MNISLPPAERNWLLAIAGDEEERLRREPCEGGGHDEYGNCTCERCRLLDLAADTIHALSSERSSSYLPPAPGDPETAVSAGAGAFFSECVVLDRPGDASCRAKGGRRGTQSV